MTEGMDELVGGEYTKERQEEERRASEDLLLTAGTYVTKPALTLDARVGDREFNAGRIEYSFFGQVENETTQERGGLRFSISPDRRDTRTGKPDGRFSLWLDAVAAFVRANGHQPHRLEEVAEYIRDYAVRLRVTRMPATEQYDAKNVVRKITPVQ